MKTIEKGIVSALCLGVTLVCAGLTGCATNDQLDAREFTYKSWDDANTTQDVKRALAHHGGKKFDGVTVIVYAGVAQLSGSVATPEERDQAAVIAGHCGNVRATVNDLVVAPAGFLATDANPGARDAELTGLPAKTDE